MIDTLVKSNSVARTNIRATVLNVVLTLTGTAYVILLSQVVFPLPYTPVMLSLGTFGVLTCGALLGSRKGAAAVALFVLLGTVGLPVFQGWKAGFGLTTGGYALGYIVGAYLVGKFADKVKSYGSLKNSIKTALSFIIGLVPIYVLGIAFLMIYLDTNNLAIGLEKGLYPFVIGEFVKIAIALGVLPGCHYGIKKLQNKVLGK